VKTNERLLVSFVENGPPCAVLASNVLKIHANAMKGSQLQTRIGERKQKET
jgi:hypothetical protein